MTELEGAVVETPTLPAEDQTEDLLSVVEPPAVKLPTDANQILRDVLKHRGWDVREGQSKMVDFIHESVQTAPAGSNVDASTNAPVGTGKTLAGLVAGLAQGGRIVVTTSTKSLQDQVVNEELPQLKEDLMAIYGYDLRFGVLKGRSNYACMDHATRLVGEPSDESDDELFGELEDVVADDIESIKTYIEKAREYQAAGDIAHFDAEWFWPMLKNKSTVATLRASHRCPTRNTPWISDLSLEEALALPISERQEIAREVAETSFDMYRAAYAYCVSSQVVVINTSLLVAEMQKQTMDPMAPKLLEGVGTLIVDEAHHLARILADAYSAEFDFGRAIKSTEDFVDKMKKRYSDKSSVASSLGSLISSLRITMDTVDDLDDAERKGEISEQEWRDDTSKALYSMTRVFQTTLPEFIDQAAKYHRKNPGDGKLNRKGIPKTVASMINELYESVVSDGTVIAGAINRWFIPRGSDDEAGPGERQRVFSNNLTYAFTDDDKPKLIVQTVPIDVSPFRSNIAEVCRQPNFYMGPVEGIDKHTVVLCSGTISKRTPTMVGMTLDRYIDVPTPFSGKKALLCVPRGLPEPSQSDWFPEAWGHAKDAIKETGGRTLILTTSYHNLNLFTEKARKTFKNLKVFSQADQESKLSLVAKFREDETSILIGTIGFWEGVDVPGPACSLVVIDKIPFPMRDDPVFQARRKYFEKLGMNPFNSVDVDHASIMLAQGAGRLIRSTKDNGGVLMLDPRVRTKRYSRDLVRLLPKDWRVTEDMDVMLDWLNWVNPQTRGGDPRPKFSEEEAPLLHDAGNSRRGRKLKSGY